MRANQHTEMVFLPAAAATVAAIAANAPIIAAIAAGIAALVTLRGRRDGALAFVTPAFPNHDPIRQITAFRPETVAFHGFEGDDALLHDVDAEDEDPEEERTDNEQVVDDLTADLDGDDNISFLPPYASGEARAVEQTDEDPLAILWEPAPDSSLLTLLNDVLEPSSKMPMPRRFALGTVAILRNLLQPADVERVLKEQKRYPRLRFGDIAVQLGFLSDAELKELLAAQEEGVFTDEEILDTKARLEAYHVESERRESA